MKKWLSSQQKQTQVPRYIKLTETCTTNLRLRGNWKPFTPDNQNVFAPGAKVMLVYQNQGPAWLNIHLKTWAFETCTNYFSSPLRFSDKIYVINMIKVKASNFCAALSLSLSDKVVINLYAHVWCVFKTMLCFVQCK